LNFEICKLFFSENLVLQLKTCHTKPKRQVFCFNANTILEI
jgi:hypothetical protein